MLDFSFSELVFASPWVFSLLILPALYVAFRIWRGRRVYPTLRLPTLDAVVHRQPARGYIRRYLWVLRALAMVAIIVAMARPQLRFQVEEVSTEGIDIVMAIDVSGSMKARDFTPNRLEAAKEKAGEFIAARPNDRIGLVIFAGESFTQVPITTDHSVVNDLLKEVRSNLLEDGTAIGMGLATAVDRLRESETKSKVVVLLTDGVNNRGSIDPMTAVEAALEFGVRVYTVGVGQNGEAQMPVISPFSGEVFYQPQKVEIDEELLQEIAQRTGGQYFRATDNASLERIYEEIDALEKSRLQVSVLTRNTEKFPFFLGLGVGLLLLELLLRYVAVRSIP